MLAGMGGVSLPPPRRRGLRGRRHRHARRLHHARRRAGRGDRRGQGAHLKPFGVDLLTALPGPGRGRHPDRHRRRRPHLRGRPRRAPRGHRPAARPQHPRRLHVRQGAPRRRRGGQRLRLRGRPGHRGRRPHRPDRHHGARAPGGRRRRRARCPWWPPAACSTVGAWPPRWRSGPTASGSAPASSPPTRPGPSPATRRRCWPRAEDGTVVSRAYTGKTCRVVRNDWTQHFDEHPEELQAVPRAGHLLGPGGRQPPRRAGRHRRSTSRREFYPCGQGVGAIDELEPAGDLVTRMVAEAEAVIDRLVGVRV